MPKAGRNRLFERYDTFKKYFLLAIMLPAVVISGTPP